jgi:hypothetical protein
MSCGAVGPAWEWHNELLSALAAARRAGRWGSRRRAHRGLAASAAIGRQRHRRLCNQAARLAPGPVTAARLERRAAGWLVEPAARRGQLGPATRLSPLGLDGVTQPG